MKVEISMNDHIHDYDCTSQRCRWCGEPRCNTAWSKTTWLQTRLMEVRRAELEKERTDEEIYTR